MVGCFCALPSFAQINFTDRTDLMPAPNPYRTYQNIGVYDLNNDGKDDIVYGDSRKIYLAFQEQPNQAFSGRLVPTGMGLSSTFSWSLCGGDVNNDGYNDILWSDGSQVIVLQRNDTGYVKTLLPVSQFFAQGANFFDIDNDGNLDAFLCNDIGLSPFFKGDGLGNWTPDTFFNLATVPASDNSGNYAAIWTDINHDGLSDLYISHCRQGITNPASPLRINQVFLHNSDHTFTQDTLNTSHLRIGAQTWCTAWGDIDNDDDMDAAVMNYSENSNVMLNDGHGIFSDITATSGILDYPYFTQNASFHDFDNDGYVDLLVGGWSSDTHRHRMYHNNGNGTFTLDTVPFDSVVVYAYGVGDLNHDGFLDVYSCSEYGIDYDKLWMNNSNSNHWLALQLEGVKSNRNGVGATVRIYGPWGVQVREVRAGEGYGIQNTFNVHFGIGTATNIDSVVVHWPSGIVDQLKHVTSDQFVTVVEGEHTLTSGAVTVTVQPNPFSTGGTLHILPGDYELEHLSLNIFDARGRIVYTENSLQHRTVRISDALSHGMYFYEVRSEEKRLASGKFIKE